MDPAVEMLARAASPSSAPVGLREPAVLREYLEDLLDPTWLTPRLDEFGKWVERESDLELQMRTLDRKLGSNVLIAGIWAAQRWESEWRDRPTIRLAAGVNRLLNMALAISVTEFNAGALFDAKARRHLQQQLRSSEHVWGMIHECETYAYLVRNATNPSPEFLCKGSVAEITFRCRGREFALQCKSKHPEAGRFIAPDMFTRLAIGVARDAKVSGGRIRIDIDTAKGIRSEDVEAVRNQARDLRGGTVGPVEVRSSDGNRVFTLTAVPLVGRGTADEFMQQAQRLGYYASMFIGDPSTDPTQQEADVMVGIRARPIERPFITLRTSIDRAADQLKGGPPGLVAVHYFHPQSFFARTGRIPPWMAETIGRKLRQHRHLNAFQEVILHG